MSYILTFRESPTIEEEYTPIGRREVSWNNDMAINRDSLGTIESHCKPY